MNYNFKIEQAFSGKITATGTGWGRRPQHGPGQRPWH